VQPRTIRGAQLCKGSKSGAASVVVCPGKPKLGHPLQWSCKDRTRTLRLLPFLAAEVVDKHLLDGLVVGFEDVADGVAADKVANFFGEILGVIAGAFERLSHEDDLEAGLAGDVFGILDVAEEDEIAEAIDFRIGAEDVDGFADIAGGESVADVGEHLFENRRHVREVAAVIGIDAARSGLRAIGKAEKQIADALEADHELHAGEEFAGLGGLDVGDDGGDGAVDFHVERVEFALALAQGVEQRAGAGGNTFGGSTGGFLGQTTSFDGAAHDVMMRRFGWRAFDACSAHEDIPSALAGTGCAD